MKKLLFLLIAFLSFAVFGQDAPPIPQVDIPAIKLIIDYIASIPVLGPYLGPAVYWLGIASAILTAISGAVYTILKIPEMGLIWAGAPNAAEKISWFRQKIMPWLLLISTMNVKDEHHPIRKNLK